MRCCQSDLHNKELSDITMVDVQLQPWSEGDLPLLEKLLGDPDMMAHLGGPETPEQIFQRHQRYLQLPETDHMFKVIWEPNAEAVGNVGYWMKNWRDQPVYETGWLVLPAYQGHGIATKATGIVLERRAWKVGISLCMRFPLCPMPLRMRSAASLVSH